MLIDTLMMRRVVRRLRKRKRCAFCGARLPGGGDMGFRIPVSNGLLCREHIEALGPAWWLFLWLIDRTTYEDRVDDETWGYVLGNTEVSAERIAGEVGMPVKTVRKHLTRLVDAGYVQTSRGRRGLHIRVARSKKFKHRDYSKQGNQRSDYSKQGNQTPDCPDQGARLPHLGHQSTPNGAITVPQTGQSQARMTVQKTLQGHDRDMRARTREGNADIKSAPDGPAPRGSEAACSEAERAARRRGAALLPAWAHEREKEKV